MKYIYAVGEKNSWNTYPRRLVTHERVSDVDCRLYWRTQCSNDCSCCNYCCSCSCDKGDRCWCSVSNAAYQTVRDYCRFSRDARTDRRLVATTALLTRLAMRPPLTVRLHARLRGCIHGPSPAFFNRML